MGVELSDITIRTQIRPGDLGYIIYLHGIYYQAEFSYGVPFESYVAGGLHAFYRSWDPGRERVWICEHREKIIGILLLADRGHSAQLRYFLITPEYRGIGLGNKLMQLYMDFLGECGYQSSYLWTTHELYAAAHLYKKHGFRFTEEIPSTNFGKAVREQRYDLVYKERRFLEITNPKEVFEMLNQLRPDTLPSFGRMTAHHMVEHLAFVVRISRGRTEVKLKVSEEEAAKAKHLVLNTDQELPKGFRVPGLGSELMDLVHHDLKTSIDSLSRELEEFQKYFVCNPTVLTSHPILGKLNYVEWIKFHNKHFTHHFKQFGILKLQI
jgi:ribosomal protein S18 acetylase RimI-like enzyme